MTDRLKSAGLALVVSLFASPAAFANETIQSACQADAANGWYNCGCVQEHYASASDGLSDSEKTALADFVAMSLNDVEAAARFSDVSPNVLITLPLDKLDGLHETCLSENFEEEMADLESESADKLAEQDAIIAVEDARIAAIPTAPAPPEVSLLPDPLPPIGTDGVLAATSFRDVVIADCRSFGNSIGFCACTADEMEKQLPQNASRAYFLTSKLSNMSAPDQPLTAEAVSAYLASKGTSQDEVDDGIAVYNAFVQSRERDDISYACQAYR